MWCTYTLVYIIYSHTSNLSGINNAVTKMKHNTSYYEIRTKQTSMSLSHLHSEIYNVYIQIRMIGYSTLKWFFSTLKCLFRWIYCPKWSYSRLKQLTHTMWWHWTIYVSTINSHSSMEPSKTRPATKRGNSQKMNWLHDK